ncbi:NACHT domain-containing protein [Micromonospora sp. CA-269861]|uniref:NACHT domain-containing protein n=1 Tax=Micromonospora sp. CA-269861 TaxID=3239968 RepID=UPI003D93C6E4
MLKSEGKPAVIYQVKWAKESAKNPITWLTSTINEEKDNIKRLVADGAQSYVLITCIAGTSAPATGSMDKLDVKLDEYSRQFGIPMTCWWRADLDARVDSAPRQLLWSYPEMLAGQDAVRYVIEADNVAAKEQGLRKLLLQVIATQWEEDAKVKFRQVELDTYNLLDLFVDVEATRIAAPDERIRYSLRGAPHRAPSRPAPASLPDSAQALKEETRLGGAAQYLLSTAQPLTLVRGEPGQGKSTLAQYLCQLHRGAFLPEGRYFAGPRPALTVETPRLPLRVDLRDYARWRAGEDPFAEDEAPPVRQRRLWPSLEKFLAHLMTSRGPGIEVSVDLVTDVINRFPMLIVLDGLDEVAHQETRARVVKEINELAARMSTGTTTSQLIVTTRPNASGLAEPSADKFETIALIPLSPALRTAYLRKWADARGLRGAPRRALEGTFRQRSIEPHIEHLADNPMQLTILLYLIQKRGDSVPDGRTQLFKAYMETFLDRESEKSPSVHEHRDDLEEVTAFLGWYLQANAETDAAAGRVPTRTLRKAILNYLDDVEKDTTLVDDLFTAVTERVWALTSKVQGTFEFDIQTMREFFAAAYLWGFAGADLRTFDKSTILGELARRSYWLNTCRFFAGFADPNELSGLVDVLEEEFESHSRPMQVRLAAWTLLSDGVFTRQKRALKRATQLFVDALSVRLILDELDRGQGTPLHARAARPLTHDRGADHLVSVLLQRVEAAPGDSMSRERLNLALQLDGVSADWWAPRMAAAAGTGDEMAWLRLGVPLRGGAAMEMDQTERLKIGCGEAAELALSAGVKATPGSALERQMVQAVLDGQCSDARLGAVSGIAGDLIQVLNPRRFLAKAVRDTWDPSAPSRLQAPDGQKRDRTRREAQRRLLERDPRFARILEAMRLGRGQTGTTSIWSDTAREIAALYGPCWLGAELAVIGAAISDKRWTTGGTFTKGAEPFGPNPDYGTLLQAIRFGRSDAGWWEWHFDAHADPLSRATWCLALICVGNSNVVLANIDRLDAAVRTLPAALQRALSSSSSRIGLSGLARRLPAGFLYQTGPDDVDERTAAEDLSTAQGGRTLDARGALPGDNPDGFEPYDTLTALLIAHHQHDDDGQLAGIPDEQLADMGRFGRAGWPGLHGLTFRMLERPSAALLDGIRAYGPDVAIALRDDMLDRIPPRLLKTILDDAGKYPLGWVIAAEKAISRMHRDEPLSQVAQSRSWFLGTG